jgi:hypothetical protein
LLQKFAETHPLVFPCALEHLSWEEPYTFPCSMFGWVRPDS